MKRKLTAAQRELAAAEKVLLDKWNNVPKFSRRQVATNVKSSAIEPLMPPAGRRNTCIRKPFYARRKLC